MKGKISIIACILTAALNINSAYSKTAFSPDYDQDLHKKMLNHTRLFYLFHSLPFGIGLNMDYKDGESLNLIKKFLSQDTENDVKKVTGFHPFELLSMYEGYGGIGLRGGGAVPSAAFRYMALKAENAPEEVLAPARKDVVRAIEALHVVYAVTGVKGVVARGIQRLVPEDKNDPPIPGDVCKPLPLFDEKGNPLPPEKNNGECRADNSKGVLPKDTWIWIDSCSKDQLVGWVMAMAALYDAANNDPKIDQSIVERMRNDAKEIGAGLREKHPFVALDGNEYLYDLVIMDSDGRPTLFHDLNPLMVEEFKLPPDSGMYNVFNLIMGIGILKGLYHVSGDPEAEKFLYEELLGKRKYLENVPTKDTQGGTDYIYMAVKTNFSNVNMIAIALFLNIFFEKDSEVLSKMREFMEHRWWNYEGVLQTARSLKQPYFHALYLAMTDRGTDQQIADEAAKYLKMFSLEPYVNEPRINCDEQELEAKKCIAIDGKTVLTIQPELNRGGWPVATEPLDPTIRPGSDFDARTDPFEVNGNGSTRINPGGDLNTAYWLLRYLPVQEKGKAVQSKFARDHMPVGGFPVKPEEDEIQQEDAIPEAEDIQTNDIFQEQIITEKETDAALPGKKTGGGCSMSSQTSSIFVMILIFSVFLVFNRRSVRKVLPE
jgi:hypothetical protein